MNTNATIGVVVVAVIVLAGGYFLLRSPAAAPAPTQVATTTDMQGMPDMGTTPAGTSTQLTGTTTITTTTNTTSTGPNVVVNLMANGFVPSTVTIKKGQSVTFVNETANPMWVASDPHPTHQGYSGTTRDQHCPDVTGTAFDQCSTGSAYTFVFQKVGSWGYHDHIDPSIMGTIVVTN